MMVILLFMLGLVFAILSSVFGVGIFIDVLSGTTPVPNSVIIVFLIASLLSVIFSSGCIILANLETEIENLKKKINILKEELTCK